MGHFSPDCVRRFRTLQATHILFDLVEAEATSLFGRWQEPAEAFDTLAA